MGVCDILSRDRVSVASVEGGPIRSKSDALKRLSVLLANGQTVISMDEIERVLTERERLQSTGVGGGVAIPHGSMDQLERIVGALLVCKPPIDFAAIDGEPVSILFAIVGPKRSTGEHLKTVTLVCRKAGGDQQEFLTIVLTSAVVSSYQSGGSAGSDVIPMDQVSLNFAKIEVKYKEQKPDGSLGGEVVGGWDQTTNKKV
jgi:PTS system nitrogen regulatory IIA component